MEALHEVLFFLELKTLIMEALRKGLALIMGVLGFFFPNIFCGEQISWGGMDWAWRLEKGTFYVLIIPGIVMPRAEEFVRSECYSLR